MYIRIHDTHTLKKFKVEKENKASKLEETL